MLQADGDPRHPERVRFEGQYCRPDEQTTRSTFKEDPCQRCRLGHSLRSQELMAGQQSGDRAKPFTLGCKMFYTSLPPQALELPPEPGGHAITFSALSAIAFIIGSRND